MSDSTPLIVAPMREEIAPLLADSDARPVLRAGNLQLFRGRLGGHDLLAAVLGDGAIAAERGWQRLLEETKPERVLLIGLAGGLSDDVATGTLVQAGAVAFLESSESVTATDATLAGLDRATVISSGCILSTARSKRQAWKSLGKPQHCVVDLESATLVRRFEESALTWTIVRAVSDSQAEDLPLDFAQLSNAEGSIVRARIVTALLRRPLALGGLLRLRSQARSCALGLARAAAGWLSL
jgi:nucleoside phosphorylase